MLLKPDHFFSISCKSEKDVFIQNDLYKNFLTGLNEELAELLQVYSFCLLPNSVQLLIKTATETQWEQFLRSKNLLQKDYQVFEEPGGMLLMGTLVQNRISAFIRQFIPQPRIIIQDAAENLSSVIVEIHKAPVLSGHSANPSEWVFSSYNAFLSDKPTRLPRTEVLEFMGGAEQFITSHN